jgi:EmrB/QacA subfamily drug resistance transporter
VTKPVTKPVTETVAAPSQPEALAIDKRSLGLVVAALFVATLLAALDQTIFATALPTIVGDLNGVEQMLWVTTAYILASTIMMPVYGKLGDLLGHKLLFFSGLTLFLGGSVLGGLAHNMSVLIAARGVQGLGGGGLMILSTAIIADIVPPRRRGTYMGIMGSAWSFASVLGPILGGWFADGIGWRWAFWFNLPLGAFAFAMAAAFLKMPLEKRPRVRLDGLGMAAMALATTAVILVTSWGGREYGWSSPPILGLIVAAVVVGVLFVLVERRAAEPVIPLALFRDRNFNLATVAGLFITTAFFGVLIYIPTYLQMVTGLTATKAGLLMVPLSLGIVSTAVGSGALASRTGRYKWMPLASVVFLGLSLYLLSTLTVGTSVWLTCFYTFLTGIGTGLSVQILLLIVQNSFPISQVGTATGAHSFFRQIGASLGSAAIGTLFTSRLLDILPFRLAALGTSTAWAVDPNSLTPARIAQMPEQIKEVVVSSYNDALAPVYLYIVPLMVIGFVLLLFVKEKPLSLTNELSAGQSGDTPD